MRPSGNQLGVRQHLRDRKAHPESIQSPIAMNSDRAAMNFGDGLDDGQAKSSALPITVTRRVNPIEAFEQVRKMRRFDRRTRIADFDAD